MRDDAAGDAVRGDGVAGGASAWSAELSRRGFLQLSGIVAFLAACGAVPSPSGGSPSPILSTGTPLPPGGVSLAFVGGTVLTMEDVTPRAAALAVDGDRIVAVGGEEAVRAHIGADTRVVDLAGRTLMPAFVDAHAHYFTHGIFDTGDPGAFLDLALANGVGTFGEAGVPEAHLEPIRDFAASGRLKPRANVYLQLDDSCGELLGGWWRDVEPTADLDAHLRIAGVKIWTDGGSCNRPARSYEYPDGSLGDLYFTPETLGPILAEADRLGQQLVIHALGDRAIALTKSALADLLAGGPNELRHRIDHNGILPPELLGDYDRSGGVAVIFGAYPTCAFLGRDPRFLYPPTPEKVVLEWDWRGLIDANPGLHVGWHSDYPVFGPESALHLYGFVTRKAVSADGSICEPTPEMLGGAIRVEEALRAMTIGAAYALRREEQVGSLVVGKLADLVILDADPTAVPPDALKDLQVLATVIGGTTAYAQGPFAALLAGLPGGPGATASPAGPTPTAGGSPSATLGGIVATASASLPDDPPSAAVDGDRETIWNAGDGPEQWIQLDLGQPRSIAGLRLLVAQSPAGPTVHQVWVGASESELRLAHEFAESTADGQELAWAPAASEEDVRVMRVLTTESPSWVAWREIEVESVLR